MSKPLEQAEQVVLIALGAGLLYGGYKLYQGLTSVGASLGTTSGLTKDDVKRQAQADGVQITDEQAQNISEALNGEKFAGVAVGTDIERLRDTLSKISGAQCHTYSGWFSRTQQCDAPPEPATVRASGRTARIRWGLANNNSHVILDALSQHGQDLDAETDALMAAGKLWEPPAAMPSGPIGASNFNPDFYGLNRDWGQILLWWGNNRAGEQKAKDAAASGDVATLQKIATGEVL